MIEPLSYFWMLLKASLFSSGGMGNLPSLHADLTERGWATDQQFAESLAIGQISPGPNGLWVICLGYLTYGLTGALLAALAICIPPFLILAVDRLHRRVGNHPAIQGFTRGLGLAVAGNSFVVLAILMQANGITPASLLIAAASIALGLSQRFSMLVMLGLAAVAGIWLLG